MKIIGIVLLFLMFSGVALGDESKQKISDNQIDLNTLDRNNDGYLDKSELVEYFLKNDEVLVRLHNDGVSEGRLLDKADVLASDVITMWNSKEEKTKVTIDQFRDFINQRAENKAIEKDLPIGWPGLGFSRSLMDDVAPTGKKIDGRPFVLSYRYDNNLQNKKGALSVLGTVTLLDISKDYRGGTIKINPGVDFDVDTAKEAMVSSIGFRLGLSHIWINSNSTLLTSHVLSLIPQYGTDRDFKRKVYEASLLWSFASKRIMKSGYNTWIGGKQTNPDDAILKVYWHPQFGLEAGSVGDTGGNLDLQKIKDNGSYIRLTAGGKISVTPLTISKRLITSIAYTNRWDLGEGWNKCYWTADAGYKIAKNVQFTVAYQNGAKTPSFTDANVVLVGVGVTQ
ncbi:hypothetical protein [Chlorobium ferrooxidans]|uniref:EF-hand domain-containing protein n=1 Tax=Chlorobium ferrooxidans DSM 13031 TaxID=377431 RepID=Q0YPD4_9CHLB|nr:hypothetical protein [Chlorobium ferrooxidans]EAT58166.1 hypothetical protein CferDRAFT_0173 [Chlorobium ferrooxidans DSM 13031]